MKFLIMRRRKKIEEEICFIQKTNVPVTQYTLKDVFRLINDVPENLYNIRHKINVENQRT